VLSVVGAGSRFSRNGSARAHERGALIERVRLRPARALWRQGHHRPPNRRSGGAGSRRPG